MRRTPTERPENQLAWAIAEINRLKALTTRITDGRSVVLVPGDPGVGDVPPMEVSEHVLYGSKHTRSLSVTAAAGVSLNVSIEQGQVWINGVFFSIAATTLLMTNATTNFVFVNNAGVVTFNTTGFPLDGIPLATVVTAGGDITSVNDRRAYLNAGSWTSMSGILTTRGDLLTRDATQLVRLGIGAAGSILRADGLDPAWTINPTIAGYMRLGSVAAPTNVTAGDLTSIRLLVGTDAALPAGVRGYFNLPAAGLVRVDIDAVQRFQIGTSTVQVGVDGSVPTLTLAAQDGVNEGGQLELMGAAANTDWSFDNFTGRVRLHTGGSEYLALRTTGLEIGPVTAAMLLSLGGPLTNNIKFFLAGTVVGAADHAFAMHFGSVSIDPADGFNAYGLFGGGTVVATAAQTVPNAYSIYAEKQAKSGTGTITNAYGVFIVAPDIGTNNIGLRNLGTSQLVGDVEFSDNLFKGTLVANADLSIQHAALGGTLTADDVIAFFRHTAIAGGTALAGFTVAAVTGHLQSRPSGAGSIIGGEFAADVGANATVFSGDVRGVYGRANVFEAGGGKTIPAMYGVLGDIGKSSAGGGYTVTDAYSGYFATPDATNIGTITNPWALFAEGTNALRGTTQFTDASHLIGLVAAGRPMLQMDGNDFLEYTRAENSWKWIIGGTQRLQFDGNLAIVQGGLLLGYAGAFVTQHFEISGADGHARFSGYERVGSIAAPVNVTSGDITGIRLAVGNQAFANSAQAHIVQPTPGNDVLQLISTTTNDDPTERVLQGRAATTDATVTTLLTVTIPASTTVMISAYVQARRTGGAAGTAEDGAAYIRRAGVKNVAGVATVIGAVQDGFTAEDQAAWDCTITFSGATALVRVTGALDNNITWHCTARVYPVSS